MTSTTIQWRHKADDIDPTTQTRHDANDIDHNPKPFGLHTRRVRPELAKTTEAPTMPGVDLDPLVAEQLLKDNVAIKSLTREALEAHCRESLTSYKMPRMVEFATELPKSNVGKILRRELREQYG